MKTIITAISNLVSRKEWFVLYDKLRLSDPEDELSWSPPRTFKNASKCLMKFPDAVLIQRKRDGKIVWKRSVIGRTRYEKVL